MSNVVLYLREKADEKWVMAERSERRLEIEKIREKEIGGPNESEQDEKEKIFGG